MEEKKKKTADKKEENNSVESEIQRLTEEVEKLKAESADYKDKWMRNVAEFDNYKKRNAKLWQDAFTEGVASVVLKILPVGDNLDRAIALGFDEKTTEGLKAVKKKYDDTLASIEIEEIDPVGETFDPHVAEAVMQVDAQEGEKSDTVKQVFEKGYKFKDKIIRYAKVSVIK